MYYLLDFIHFYVGDFATIGELKEKLAKDLLAIYDDDEVCQIIDKIVKNLGTLVKIDTKFVYNCYETTIYVDDSKLMLYCVDEFKQKFYI